MTRSSANRRRGGFVPTRRLHHETLESRRLLAADALTNDATCLPIESLRDDAFPGIDSPMEEAASTAIASPFVDSSAFGIESPFFRGPDLIQEVGDRVFIVDQSPFDFHTGNLFIFQRDSDHELELLDSIEVSLPVEQMIVAGDQVVLFTPRWYHWLSSDNGQRPTTERTAADRFSQPQTQVTTVTLGDEVSVVRQEFDRVFDLIDHSEGRLVMHSVDLSVPVITIYPPPPIPATLHTFEITQQGIRETAKLEIPAQGIAKVAGHTILVAQTLHTEIVYFGDPADPNQPPGIRAPDDRPLPHFEIDGLVTQYRIAEESITEVTSLRLGQGAVGQLHLAEDGQSATVVRTNYETNSVHSEIDLLDLSGEQMRRFETVDSRGTPLALWDDYVLLSDFQHSMFVVDTNLQIDINAENRVRAIELPDGLATSHTALRLMDDRVVVLARRHPNGDRTEAGGNPPVDSSTDAIGNSADEAPIRIHPEQVLLTISLGEATILAHTPLGPISSIAGAYQLFEIDAVDGRFGYVTWGVSTAGFVDQQLVYGRIDDGGEFRREGRIEVERWQEIDADPERLLVRTANRLIEYRWDAIDDPVITPLDDVRPVIRAVNDFYRLSENGDDQLLDVLANDLTFDRQAKIIRLDGAPEGTEIVEGRMIRLPGSALHVNASLRFEYVIGDSTDESTAVVEIQVIPIERAALVELGLQAVDDAGEIISEITAAETFWIQFTATDLRLFPKGVFAAFFDLEVPVETIVLTGDVEYGEGFQAIRHGDVGDGFVDDLGAIGEIFDPAAQQRREVLRIGAIAVGAGEVTLIPDAADQPGTETLLRGQDTEVPDDQLQFASFTLSVLPEVVVDPLDADGNGEVTALDALKIINFLAQFGSTTVADLDQRIGGENLASDRLSVDQVETYRRYDTNANDIITALDALVVINRLAEDLRQLDSVADGEQALAAALVNHDDDER